MFELIRLLVPHEPWSGHLDNVDIGHADDDCGPDGGHEGETVSPGVTQLLHHVYILTIKPRHAHPVNITLQSSKPCQDSSCHVKCHVGCKSFNLEEKPVTE